MTDGARTLILIPARGGSRRLPRKSLRAVGGVPLIGRSLAVARRAVEQLSISAEVAVSTDDASIADAALRFGARVPWMRPAALAADDTPTIAVVRHMLDQYAARGQDFDEVVLMQPTSPLRTADDVVRAILAHRSNTAQASVTVRAGSDGSASTQFYMSDGLLMSPGGGGEPVVLNGAVYVFTPQWARRHDMLAVPGRTRAVMMPAERSIDVDTADDLAEAQAIWEARSPWPAGRCYVIAEAGVNHDGDVDVARRLVDAAAEAGADAVKFQTFDPQRLASKAAAKAAYQQRAGVAGETQREMLAQLALSADDHRALQEHCRARGITFLSSAFGAEDVDLLDALDVPMLKLGSGEITNHPLLVHAAATLRPVILSTGASDLQEVKAAVEVLRCAGCDRLALLHCVSAYPAPPSALNLRAMETLVRKFDVPVGFSDHTLGNEAAIAAAARGARIIEKHLTLDRSRRGPDHHASLEPREFRDMVAAIRNIEVALGDGVKRPQPIEESVRVAARRSLVAARSLRAGSIFHSEDVASKRPGTGISPADLARVVGRRLLRDVRADALIGWDDLGPIENSK